MKRQVKFYFDFLYKQKFERKELTRFFLKANNFIFVNEKESLARLINRCYYTGSPHSLKKVNFSRQTFREFINSKKIPAIQKASW